MQANFLKLRLCESCRKDPETVKERTFVREKRKDVLILDGDKTEPIAWKLKDIY